MANKKAFRAAVAHCLDDPFNAGNSALEYIEDALLVVDNGKVEALGSAPTLLADPRFAQLDVVDYSGHLIVPGFVDAHLHYPQTDIIASYGSQLLEWLEKYTFPAEGRFHDEAHALEAAGFFVNELLRNGTTSGMIFASVHPQSVDALFKVAEAVNLRIGAGKVMMDRNCPDYLQDTAQQGYEESQQLIDQWHGVGRLSYAVTPRFAPTSTDEQLQLAGKLYAENNGVYLQSHVAENKAEVEWVAELFPWSRSYLDVYDRYGLLGERAIYAHCIYLDDSDLSRMHETGTVAAFCPTSNLFLGSGLFDLQRCREMDVRTGLATDVGGGTSFSMLRTADEAYKVSQMAGRPVTPVQLFYEMTLGGASALSMQQYIGNFETGKEADFVVLDTAALPLLQRRIDVADSFEEKLFALIVLGDDRITAATYVMGEAAYRRNV
jgi:guanine deaminase